MPRRHRIPASADSLASVSNFPSVGDLCSSGRPPTVSSLASMIAHLIKVGASWYHESAKVNVFAERLMRANEFGTLPNLEGKSIIEKDQKS